MMGDICRALGVVFPSLKNLLTHFAAQIENNTFLEYK
jgi:hypothetical protein